MVGVSVCKHSSGAGLHHQIHGSEYWYLRRRAGLALLYFCVEHNRLCGHYVILHLENLIMFPKGKKGSNFSPSGRFCWHSEEKKV